TGLENLQLPEGITAIEANAFADCIKLKTVILPTTLETIGEGAFRGCYSLQIMSLPFIGQAAGTETGEEALFGWIFSIPEFDAEKDAMREVTQIALIDGETTEVTYYIPMDLTKVVIYGETAIGYGAFSGCKDLVALIIKDNGIDAIGDYAFYDCVNLTYILDIEAEYPVIVDGEVTHPAFNRDITYTTDDTEDYNIHIYDEVTSIGNYAFMNCVNVQSVIMPECVETIGDYAFANCTSLTKINEGLINQYDFDNIGTFEDGYDWQTRDNLYNYLMPEGMTSIGAFAFFNNGLVTSIYIPNTVTFMGEGIFGGCSSIEMLSIPFVGGVNAKSEDYAYNQTMGYMFYTEEVDGCTAVEQNNITYYI
ncbi:MAG: leucine-rich repeat domain-containing protein, partial [Anaeroplasmataceae bacterium]|nr:leucine-rich repeat domain-containing protein [Anaeroplasmataceae bacterium]